MLGSIYQKAVAGRRFIVVHNYYSDVFICSSNEISLIHLIHIFPLSMGLSLALIMLSSQLAFNITQLAEHCTGITEVRV